MNDLEAAFPANVDQAQFWDRVGADWVAYQAIMDRHLAKMTRLLFARAAPHPGERVIDVGCGAGQTARMHAEAVAPSGTVLAVDISAPLVAAAKSYCADLPHVRIELGDAQVWPFESRGADLVASRFGVMFFADPYVAFANLARALGPGGRMHFVAWGPPPRNPFFGVPMGLAQRYFGPLEKLPPRTPGPLALAERDYVEDLLVTAGLATLGIDEVETDMADDGGAESFAAFLMEFGPLSRVLREQDPDRATRAALHADLIAALKDFERDGVCTMPMVLNYVAAERP